MNALDSLTWPDVARHLDRVEALAVVAVGSCEQHGPHLPFTVDTTVAQAVATEFCRHTPEAILAPPLTYGASGEHEGFPGTVSIGHEALAALLVELGRSATRWAARVLFVSGHGGNARGLALASKQLRLESRDVAWWPCGLSSGDAHAGHTETSLVLALNPGAVEMELAARGRPESIGELMPRLREEGVARVSPSGILGDATTATAADGVAAMVALVESLRRAVTEWDVGATGRLAVAGHALRGVRDENR